MHEENMMNLNHPEKAANEATQPNVAAIVFDKRPWSR